MIISKMYKEKRDSQSYKKLLIKTKQENQNQLLLSVIKLQNKGNKMCEKNKTKRLKRKVEQQRKLTIL